MIARFLKYCNSFLPILAIIISVITFFYSYRNDREMQELTFYSNASTNKALLMFDKQQIGFAVSMEEKFPGSLRDDYVSLDPTKKFTFRIQTKIKLSNTGNSTARVIFKAVGSKTSGLPDLRNKIMKAINDKDLNFETENEYYKNVSVFPNESKEFDINCDINDFDHISHEFTIHFLIIYANELDNYFDSYIWLRFKSDPIRIEFGDEIPKSLFYIPDASEKIKLIDTNFSTKIYSLSESKKITNIHNVLKEKYLQEE